MLLIKSPEVDKDNKKLRVEPRAIEVVLSEDLFLRPLLLSPIDSDEINAIRQTEVFSIENHGHSAMTMLAKDFASAIAEQKAKETTFGGAQTYFQRMADWASIAGDFEEEGEYLRRAEGFGKTEAIGHRVGENLLALGRLTDAEYFFRQMDLEHDAYANLRLAYFHIQRQELEQAAVAVSRAVSLEPESFSTRLFEGALLLASGKYSEAIRSFRIAEESRPNSSALHANTAVAYLRLGQSKKAVISLRKAVTFDPLNKNAQAMLADVCFSEQCNEESINNLRYYLTLEDGDSAMWARLARALFHVGEYIEALSALRHQCARHEDSTVWNNIGATYWKLKNSTKAGGAFSQALKLADKENIKNLLFVSRSLTLLLTEVGEFKSAITIASEAIGRDTEGIALKDKILSQLYKSLAYSLSKVKRYSDAAAVASLAKTGGNEISLRAWASAFLIAHYTRRKIPASEMVNLIRESLPLLKLVDDKDFIKIGLTNNIAFALAEQGELAEAQFLLSMVSHAIHKDPYVTATSGLISMKKGHSDKGVSLYRSAIALLRTTTEKSVFRQKLNVELGRYFVRAGDFRKAEKALRNAAEEKAGEDYFVTLAKDEINKLRTIKSVPGN